MRSCGIRMLVALMLMAAGASAQNNVQRYEIEITRLNSEEALLLKQYNKAIDMRKYDIERQLETVRSQRMEIERLRADALQSAAQIVAGPSSSRTVTHVHEYVPVTPPTPDWKEIEKPTVVVKGIMDMGGKRAALVSGGQIVFSNDVFSTTYQGKVHYWRVTEVTADAARFAEVDSGGQPLPPPAATP